LTRRQIEIYRLEVEYGKKPVSPTPPQIEEKELPREAARLAEGVLPASAGDVVVDTPKMRVIFTKYGARIKSIRLKDYPEEVVDEKALRARLSNAERALRRLEGKGEVDSAEYARYLRERTEAEYLLQEASRRKEEIKRLEEALEKAKGSERERIREDLAAARGVELVPAAGPLDGIYPLAIYCADEKLREKINSAQFQVEQATGEKGQKIITFTYKDEGIEVRKQLWFYPEGYIFDIIVSISYAGQEEFSLEYAPGVGLFAARRSRTGNYSPVTLLEDGGNLLIHRETKETPVPKFYDGKLLWTGLRNKYFAAVLIPTEGAKGAQVYRGREQEFVRVLLKGENGQSHGAFKVFLGPQKREILLNPEAGVITGAKDAEKVPLTPRALNFGKPIFLEKLIYFGKIDPIARIVYYLLMWLRSFAGNWGIAIILLTAIVKIVFHPLTHKSFVAMQQQQEQMARLQPEIAKLREKYKNDPQKLNRAIWDLYKEHNVSPMGGCKSGCLPMLFQIPVFFSLYAVLDRAIELRGAPFLGWIKDLSQADPYMILPITMGITMYFQQRLSQVGSQTEEQRMMNWMMPVLFVVIFRSLPAGVVLYWLSYNIITVIQQLIIKRRRAHAAP